MTYDSRQDPHHLYFITASICGWRPLFSQSLYATIVLDSLQWLRIQNRMKLFAFVLMPTHLHAIIKPENFTIGEVLQQFGSFTSHAIIKRLSMDNCHELLQIFSDHARDKRHKHSVWQDIQAENIFSEHFLIQKLEYIHQNPINKNWKLVQCRSDYRYSSARFYDNDQPSCIDVDDLRIWLSSSEEGNDFQQSPPGTAV